MVKENRVGERVGICLLAVLLCLFVSSGCGTVQTRYPWSLGYYPKIAVQAVDADTGEPIEGAIALGVWTLTKFFIEQRTEIYEVVEVETGKDGRFTIGGCCWRSDVNAPELTIYKRGYVAWNNIASFTAGELRTDFAWKNGFVAKLEKWKDRYSFIEHEAFISRYAEFLKTKYFHKAYEWETDQRVQERDRRNELRDWERRK